MVLFGRYCLQLWTTKEDRYDLTTVEHKIHTSKGNTPIPLKMEVHYWEGLHAAINMIFCVFKALKCDLHPELRLQVPKIIPDSFGQFKNIVSTLSLSACLNLPPPATLIRISPFVATHLPLWQRPSAHDGQSPKLSCILLLYPSPGATSFCISVLSMSVSLNKG